jgi:Predicted hydrolases or acyltransferases (alpha/beta hydrolase superfamily)
MGDGLVQSGRYEGPTLFIKGSRSNYYKTGDEKAVSEIFPKTEWKTLDTGHWVQAEKPQEFAEAVLEFLA